MAVEDNVFGHEEAVAEFITQWRLQEDAQQALFSASYEVQQKVLSEFNPRDTSRDVTAIFLKFLQSRSNAAQSSDKMSEFITMWSLGPDAQAILAGLHPQTRVMVMNDFAPRDTSSDVNNIFMKFAQSIGKSGGKKGGFKGAGKGDSKGFGKAGKKSFAQPASHYVPIQVPTGATLDDPVLVQFAEKWNLRDDAQSMLASLSPHAQQKVLTEFAPRDTSRDANGIFLRFASNLAVTMPAGAGAGAAPVRHQRVKVEQGYGGEHEQFVAKWRLNETAQQLFYGLAPEHQQKVMMEFAPRDTSSDANNIFMKFCQGVSRGSSAKATSMVQNFLAQWRLGPDAQALFYSLLPDQQQRVMVEFSPRDASADCNNIFMKFCQGVARGTSGKGAGKAAAGAPGIHGGNGPEENFLAQWRLGAEAQQQFYALIPEQQQRVMMEFAPRDPSTDCNLIFIKFCQGVARGGSSSGKGKGRSSPY